MFNFVYKNIDFSHKSDGHSLPLDDFKKHMHDFYELLFFVKGKVEYNIDSETKHLQPGDVILIHPGCLHFGNVNTSESYERFVLKFPISILPDSIYQDIMTKSPFLGSYPNLQSYFTELEEIYHRYQGEQTYILLICQLYKILIDLSHYTKDDFHEMNQNTMIVKVIDYINSNIRENITLADIASKLNFSKSYISNEFKRVMNMPIMTYIRYKKIIQANLKIQSGNYKISEVCEEFGFNDYSTFYRNYKKIMGKSPVNESKIKNK